MIVKSKNAHALATMLALAVSPLAALSAAAETFQPDAISDETRAALCPPGFAIVDLSCTGRYCDNVQALCSRFATKGAPRQGEQYWTDWFSEESSSTTQEFDGSTWPKLRNAYSLAVGIQCRGSYCDDIRLRMELIHPSASASGGVTMDSKAEKPVCRVSRRTISEETMEVRVQPPMSFIRRVGCSGSYCDNLRFETCSVYRQ